MRAMATGKLNLPVTRASSPDDAPGQLQTARNGADVMRCFALHHCPHVWPCAHQLTNHRAHERFEGYEGAHWVAREHDHWNSIMAYQSEALRLSWLHGDLGEVAGTHLGHHCFDDVVVSLTDSARCQDQVSAQQLISYQPFELMAIITDLSDSEYLGACCLCGGGKQVGVGVEDLLLVAELEPWIHQLRPSGDHDNPRPGANLHL